MKNKILAVAILFLCSIGMHAQIDRSVRPKPGPAPKINLGKPDSFNLKNGLKVLVVENHVLPRVSMTLSLDNPPNLEGKEAGISSLMGTMLGEGTQEIPKEEFNEEIDFMGANVRFFSSGASANSLSRYFPRVLELMSKGALHPNFTQDEFEKQQERALEGLKVSEKDVASNASRLTDALVFGKDHPYGEFTTEESLKGLILENVKSYYNTYFVPQNAYLVVVGDVKTKEVKKMAKKYFANWKKKTLPENTMSKVDNVSQTEIDFINFPNAVQSEIQVVNTIKLKQGDPDYFPVLMANQILGGGGEGRLFLNLREDKGYTYGAYSRTGNDKYVAKFSASASVRNAVTDSAVIAFLDELYRIRDEKVSKEELENAKAKYTGNFVMSLERPSTIAQFALAIEINDLPSDFYETYLKKIDAVTVEDVERVAKKYYLADNARIVIVGKGSEVLGGLENLSYHGKKIPVNYFDKDANSTEKPEVNKQLDPAITAQVVFDKYIDAIGGKEAVQAVNSVYTTARADFQNQKLDLEMKMTKSGKMAVSVAMGPNVLSKQVYNGEKGFVVARGQTVPYDEEQMAAAKVEAHPFPELTASNRAEVLGIEDIDGEDAYVVSMSEDTKNYFSVDSGLKLQEVKTVSQGDQTMTLPTSYSDYQAVKGIKFPFTITQSMGPQSFVFKVKEVKINEGVNDADFQ